MLIVLWVLPSKLQGVSQNSSMICGCHQHTKKPANCATWKGTGSPSHFASTFGFCSDVAATSNSMTEVLQITDKIVKVAHAMLKATTPSSFAQTMHGRGRHARGS
jgi:hypothetical protein